MNPPKQQSNDVEDVEDRDINFEYSKLFIKQSSMYNKWLRRRVRLHCLIATATMPHSLDLSTTLPSTPDSFLFEADDQLVGVASTTLRETCFGAFSWSLAPLLFEELSSYGSEIYDTKGCEHPTCLVFQIDERVFFVFVVSCMAQRLSSDVKQLARFSRLQS